MEPHYRNKSILAIILIVLVTAVLFKYVSVPEEWDTTLALPSYISRIGIIFGFVWSTLAVLWAVSMFLAFNALQHSFWKTIGPLNVLSGALLVLWSYVFFVLHDVPAAAVTAGLFTFSLCVLFAANFKTSKVASVLLLPAVIWGVLVTGVNIDVAARQGNVDKPDELPMPVTVVLSVGQSYSVDQHLTLTLDRINDSRCPAEAYCVWQGELSAEMSVKIDKVTLDEKVFLGTVMTREAEVNGYHLTLVDANLESATIMIE